MDDFSKKFKSFRWLDHQTGGGLELACPDSTGETRMEFELLKRTPVWRALSERGKRMFLPQGIFYWAGRAKREAEINATIGSAGGLLREVDPAAPSDASGVYYLPVLTNRFGLPSQAVVPYAPIAGLPAFRGVWKDWLLEKCPDLDPSLVSSPVVVPGITGGLYLAGLLFLDPGAPLVCPNKRWGNYDNVFAKNLGARLASFPFFTGQRFDADAFRTACVEATKGRESVACVLNFPNNPTGYVPDSADLSAMLEATRAVVEETGKPLVVLLDDAYEGFVYDGDRIGRSVFSEFANFHELVVPVKLDGISKELLAYGARVGAMTLGLHEKWGAPEDRPALLEEWENKVSGLIRATVSNCNRAMQEAAARVLAEDAGQFREERRRAVELLAKRCRAVNSEFRARQARLDAAGASVDPNAGGFFLFVNLPAEIPAAEFADYLLREKRVGAIPVVKDEPGENRVNGIRLAYASVDESASGELVERFVSALESFPRSA
ncbi:MAG: aminotransferase class I/II-fold pyridoxal phosphate-dependent enzyme [Promethearchaeota archaeon]